LGDGTSTHRTEFKSISIPGTQLQVSAGHSHIAFITDDNKVYITGAEENNRLINYNSEKNYIFFTKN
jgi:alpha-tubulin suppressor-like RCC1 family protein